MVVLSRFLSMSLSHAALAAHVPLAIATRGPAVESIHYGSIAVVDRSGRLVYAAGDPEVLTFTRSSLKPLQALPFVAAGGVEPFCYSMPEGALLCRGPSREAAQLEAPAPTHAQARKTAAD